MKLLFLIYVICLFIIFTPGVFFFIYKKDKIINILIHGLLFSGIFYISSQVLNNKIIEGNDTISLHVSDLSNLFDLQQKGDLSSENGKVIDPDTNTGSPEVQMAKKNSDAMFRLKNEISGENKTLVTTIKNEVDKMKKELTNYKFNPKKSNFICTMELPNFDFSKPQIESNSYNYYNSKTLVPGWNLNRAVLLNNSKSWGFKTPYPNGSQAIALQNTASISTVVTLYPGNYFIKCLTSGRDCCDKTGIPNMIDIKLNENTFDSFTPELTDWKPYKSKPINIETEGEYVISLHGTNKTEVNGTIDKSSAIKNIVIHRE
jgi:hypothetical protein